MAGFVLAILEGVLGLTETEKQAIEPCLPHAKDMIDRISQAWPSVESGQKVIADNPALIARLLNDVGVLLPNASALLGDGYVDCGTALATVKDLQSACKAHSATVDQVMGLYNALEPVIVHISSEWPKVAPAYDAVLAAAKRKGYDLSGFLGKLHGSFLSTAKPNPKPPPSSVTALIALALVSSMASYTQPKLTQVSTVRMQPVSTQLNVSGPQATPPSMKA